MIHPLQIAAVEQLNDPIKGLIPLSVEQRYMNLITYGTSHPEFSNVEPVRDGAQVVLDALTKGLAK